MSDVAVMEWMSTIFCAVSLLTCCVSVTHAATAHSCGTSVTTTVYAYDDYLSMNDVVGADVREVVFNFTSCYTGYLSLSVDNTFANDYTKAYEVWISNTAGLYLYNCHECATNFLIDSSLLPVTLNPADCLTTVSTYWLTWDADTFLMGWGPTVGDTPLISVEPLAHEILYLGVRSQPGGPVTWNFQSCVSTVGGSVNLPGVTSAMLPTVTSTSGPTSTIAASTTTATTAGYRYKLWKLESVDVVAGFNYTIAITMASRSGVECARWCMATASCNAFAFTETPDTCQLLSATSTANPTSLQWIYVPI